MASLEATKSVFELTSPVSGTIEEICVREGDTVPVGAPLGQSPHDDRGTAPETRHPGTVRHAGAASLESRETLHLPRCETKRRAFDVGISRSPP